MRPDPTRCKYGHELTPENSIIRQDRGGTIECRVCAIIGRAEYKKRRPLYQVWSTMLKRCNNPKFKDWKYYGGRLGNPVTVCERWNDYDAFASDVPPRPSMTHTLDRIDGKLGYFKENVKWSTPKEQARNVSNNRIIEHNGVSATLAEWVENSGLKYATVIQRLDRSGMSFADAISAPVGLPTDLNSVRGPDGRYQPQPTSRTRLHLAKRHASLPPSD